MTCRPYPRGWSRPPSFRSRRTSAWTPSSAIPAAAAVTLIVDVGAPSHRLTSPASRASGSGGSEDAWPQTPTLPVPFARDELLAARLRRIEAQLLVLQLPRLAQDVADVAAALDRPATRDGAVA